MEILRFEQLAGHYTVRVSSKDLTLSWNKFRGRINNYDTYCKYAASDEGSLHIFNYDSRSLENITPEQWPASRPVFYETNEYSFTIAFKNIDGVPEIIHADKDIENLFNVIEIADGYLLNGTINFLNQPGRFSLKFKYNTLDGHSHQSYLDFDVVSPKMDIKDDLNQIIQQVKAEYDELVFRYLTLTLQQFSLGKEATNELIWLSIFRQIIDQYVVAVRFILNAPHNRDYRNIEFRKADRIKRWTPSLAEKFCDDRKRDEEQAFRTYYRTEQIESTTDTLENRFVKYTLVQMQERLQSIAKRIKVEGTSQNELDSIGNYIKDLEILRHNSFFKPIGRFEGFKQESMVLQQRNGYAQVYRYWIMLQNGLNLIDGNTSVGVQPIWKLYELWCFLKVKRNVCEILGLNPLNQEDQQYIEEDVKKAFDPFNGGDVAGHVTYTNKRNDDKIEIGYQYTFNRYDNGMRSLTVEQKPDIVMHIHKKDGITLTYLFDAKYRVLGEDDDSVNQAIDYPVEETLNQMHRYRDAIYYEERSGGYLSKEVVGGYILFPGRAPETDYQHALDIADFRHLPYYISAIEKVNIGAFPLLPSEGSGLLLKNFLRKVILHESMREQIEDSIAQRGLYYSYEGDSISVLFGSYKNDEHHQWIQNQLKYNLRLDKGRKGAVGINNDFTHAQYLVLYKIGDQVSRETYKITGENQIVTAEDLIAEGYPSPGGKVYLELELSNEIDPRLIGREWSLPTVVFDMSEGEPKLLKYLNPFEPEWDESRPEILPEY